MDDNTEQNIVPTSILQEHLQASHGGRSKDISYNFTSLTVISSSKINHKVAQILKFLGNDLSEDPVEAAAGIPVVSLSVKSSTASKAISIAEIVKRNFVDSQKQTTENRPQELFQYNILHSVPPQAAHTSKNFRSGAKSHEDQNIIFSRERLEDTHGAIQDSQQISRATAETFLVGTNGDDRDFEDEYFETIDKSAKDASLLIPATAWEDAQTGAIADPMRSRRNIPVLTIVLSKAPIQSLATRYGEQRVV